jgi:hypothetical protein
VSDFEQARDAKFPKGDFCFSRIGADWAFEWCLNDMKDGYVKEVGAWKIIQRLEEQNEQLTKEAEALARQLELCTHGHAKAALTRWQKFKGEK